MPRHVTPHDELDAVVFLDQSRVSSEDFHSAFDLELTRDVARSYEEDPDSVLVAGPCDGPRKRDGQGDVMDFLSPIVAMEVLEYRPSSC